MKTILVPIDYSSDSRQAFTFAIDIASISKAGIVLLHVFHEPLSTGSAFKVDEAIAQLEIEKNKILEEFASEVKFDCCKNFNLQFKSTQNAGSDELENLTLTSSGNHLMAVDEAVNARAAVEITCVSKFGLAAEEILAAVGAYHADLVIMNTRGAGAISQAFMGSTVAAVIQAAKVPVLALSSLKKPKQIKNIVFATDLNRLPGNFLLDSLRALIKVLGADLQVLHLYQDNNLQEEQAITLKALEVLDTQLFDLNYQVHFRPAEDIATNIREFVQDQQADLLVLIPSHHTFLEKLFQKSITGKFTGQAIIPLLTLPYLTNPLPVAATQKITEEKR